MLRMSPKMLVFALVLACGLTLWVAWEVLTPPTTAVQAQSTDNNTQQVSVTRVVDGDTIEGSIGGERHTVRYIGLDTPETFRAACDSEHARGEAAKQELQRLLASGRVTVQERGSDKFRQTLAHGYVDGRDGAELMIRSGHARPYNGHGKRCRGAELSAA